jgi:hypothetical protein
MTGIDDHSPEAYVSRSILRKNMLDRKKERYQSDEYI